MKANKILPMFLGIILAAGSMSCGILSRPMTTREQTAGIGGLTGGASGAIIGSLAGGAVAGGLVGMPLGLAAGYLIGDQIERRDEYREARLEDKSGSQWYSKSDFEESRGGSIYTKGDVVGDVSFDSGRADLKRGAARDLEHVVMFLKEDPSRKVIIEGHTDNVGAESYNLALSKKRAEAVRNFLVKERDINAKRITAVGMGEAYPIASNDTETGRNQNRRVEILVSQ